MSAAIAAARASLPILIPCNPFRGSFARSPLSQGPAATRSLAGGATETVILDGDGIALQVAARQLADSDPRSPGQPQGQPQHLIAVAVVHGALPVHRQD